MKKALILFGILTLWWLTDLILSSALNGAKDEYVTQKAFGEGFEQLKQRWSPQNKKEVIKKIDTLFEMHKITPKTTEVGNLKSYRFLVTNENAEILNSIFAQPVEINSFVLTKSDEYTLNVELEIKY